MDETLQVEDRNALNVREPSSVHSAALHAAVTLAEGSCQIQAVKIEFELDGGLVMGTPTSNGCARITTARDGVWKTNAPNRERFFRFTLDSIDRSVAPARGTGGFKLIARKRGDDRLLFVEGSFGLREFDT